MGTGEQRNTEKIPQYAEQGNRSGGDISQRPQELKEQKDRTAGRVTNREYYPMPQGETQNDAIHAEGAPVDIEEDDVEEQEIDEREKSERGKNDL